MDQGVAVEAALVAQIRADAESAAPPLFAHDTRYSRQLFSEEFAELRISPPLDISSRAQLVSGPERLARSELKKVISLAVELSLDPPMRELGWNSLFSGELGQRLSRAFPLMVSGLSEHDLCKAVILSEKDGKSVGALGGLHIDRAADALMRLEKYLSQPHGTIRTKPASKLFEELVTTVFGTYDRTEIAARYSVNERRSFQLGFIDLIASIEIINSIGGRILAEPKSFLNSLLAKSGKELGIRNPVYAEILPYAVVFYLEKRDFERIQPPNVLGAFFPKLSSAPELSGRVAIVKRSGTDHEVNGTREHELRHHFFHQYFRRSDGSDLRIDDELKKLAAAPALTREDELAAHRDLSRRIFLKLIDYARDEIVAHSDEKDPMQRPVSAYMGSFWGHVAYTVSTHLNRRSDLTPDYKNRIAGYYKGAHAEFLEWLCQARILANSLYKRASNEQGDISKNKVEALALVLGPEEFVKVGRRYLGISRREFKKLVEDTRVQAAEDLRRTVPGSLFSRLTEIDGARYPTISFVIDAISFPFTGDSWAKKTKEVLAAIQSLVPIQALPILTDVIRTRRDSGVFRYALSATDNLLARHGAVIEPRALHELKDALASRVMHFSSTCHHGLDNDIRYILREIDHLLNNTLTTFAVSQQELEFSKLIASPLGKLPSISQLKDLCETLPVDDIQIWLSLIETEHLQLLDDDTSIQAAGVLLLISERCPEPNIKSVAARLFQRRMFKTR